MKYIWLLFNVLITTIIDFRDQFKAKKLHTNFSYNCKMEREYTSLFVACMYASMLDQKKETQKVQEQKDLCSQTMTTGNY